MRQFVEKCWNRPNLTFGDLWWADLWPDLKNDRSSFFVNFDALSNAVCRVSLHGPWAELDGGVCSNTPRPGAFGAEQRPGRLFGISPEPLRRSSPNFQYPPGQQFYTLWPNIFPKAMIGCPQMTSEWRHVLPFSAQKKRFRGKSCQAYSFEDTEKRSNIKGVELGIRATKLPSRNFRFLEFWCP